MVFSSLEFLFVFLPIFLVLYYCLPAKFRNGLLFVGSLLFYGIGEPTYLLLILYSVLVNYLLGLLIGNCKAYPIRKRLLLIISLLYNFGLLFYFKYMDFFLENINAVLRLSGSSLQFNLLQLVLPLGISFYTFQIVSYIIDVYRGSVPVEKSFVNLGTPNDIT